MTDPKTTPSGDPTARRPLPQRPPVKRFSTTLDPDRTPQHALDPVLTRKGGATAHKGILFMVAAGLIVMAIAFNVGGIGDQANQLFDSVNKSAQSENNIVVSTVILVAPYVGAAILGLILYFMVRGLFRGARNVTKEVKLSKREEISIHDFVAMTKEKGISTKVSREAYRLLLPHYHGEMRLKLDDNLEHDLHLSMHDAIELYASLLRKSDRVLRGMEGKSAKQPETVMELLCAVNDAPVRAALHTSRVRSAIRHLSVMRPAHKVPKQ